MNRELFIDTSIAIKRTLGSEQIKRNIAETIKVFDECLTGLVVRQEYKRRILEEAQYLLNQLKDKGSLKAVYDHVTQVLPPQQSRKRNIALALMGPVFFPKAGDEELTERFKRLIRTLLRTGMDDFDARVDRTVGDSECACAKAPIIEKKPYLRYDLGPKHCSKTAGACGIVEFIKAHPDETKTIFDKISSLPDQKKSAEIQKAESFLREVLTNPNKAPQLDPCLTVGDLVIALESAGVPNFYTMNGKESQHLCRALNQTLILRPNNPEKSDVVHSASDPLWAEY